MPENLAKLRWRCRRGMKELDMLLNAYLEEDYVDASGSEQDAFHLLLEQQDPDMYGWFLGRAQSDNPELQALVVKIGKRLQSQ